MMIGHALVFTERKRSLNSSWEEKKPDRSIGSRANPSARRIPPAVSSGYSFDWRKSLIESNVFSQVRGISLPLPLSPIFFSNAVAVKPEDWNGGGVFFSRWTVIVCLLIHRDFWTKRAFPSYQQRKGLTDLDQYWRVLADLRLLEVPNKRSNLCFLFSLLSFFAITIQRENVFIYRRVVVFRIVNLSFVVII